MKTQWNKHTKWSRCIPLMLIAGAVSVAGAGAALAQGVWSADNSMPQATTGPTTAVSGEGKVSWAGS